MLSDIILKNGDILLTQDSSSSVSINGNTNLQFGTIQLVSQLSDSYSIGQQVLYNPDKTELLTFENVNYSLVNEENILLIPPIVPAP